MAGGWKRAIRWNKIHRSGLTKETSDADHYSQTRRRAEAR
jgi:hypothetical protein